MIRRLFLAFIPCFAGCFWTAEVNGSFTTAAVSSGPQQSGRVNVRGAIGRGGDVFIGGDIQLARLRFSSDEGRYGVGGGMYLAVGDIEMVLATISLGVNLFDVGWGERAGWGIGSPYMELGGSIRFGERSLLSLTFHGGVEYEVRFSGPQDGLFVYAGLGLAISDLF